MCSVRAHDADIAFQAGRRAAPPFARAHSAAASKRGGNDSLDRPELHAAHIAARLSSVANSASNRPKVWPSCSEIR